MTKFSRNFHKYLILMKIKTLLLLLSISYLLNLFTTISFELTRSVSSCTSESKKSNLNHSFAKVMQSFPWDEYEHAVVNKNGGKSRNYSDALMTKLLPYLIKPPRISINKSCKAPPLEIPESVQCTPLERPRKVGILFLFSFEIDALEVHLNELDAVVDKFFIVESIRPHSRFLSQKHLLWDRIKSDERFSSFQSKIVHFVVDDANIPPPSRNRVIRDLFQEERLQEKLRWIKFLEWNAAARYFGGNDLLGFGDVDEIPDRNVVYTLKNCAFNKFPIDIGIWFPFPYLNTMFLTDWPVPGHPFTLGDPTYWTFSEAVNATVGKGIIPGRMRGKSPAFLLGGMHMSLYAYPPYEMIKHLSGSETTGKGVLDVIGLGKLLSLNDSAGAVQLIISSTNGLKNRIQSIPEVSELNEVFKSEVDKIVRIPWLIQCNPKRYPSLFEGGYDLRLED